MKFDARRTRSDSRRWKLLIAAALATTGLNARPGTAQLPAAAAPPAARIEQVAWLQGCWSLISGEREVEEYWMAPKGTSILGIARTTHSGLLADYEMTLIREAVDRLVFEAHPSNQPMALFHSIEISQSRILFENPKHDFPQRIGYERKGNALLAWIEGTQNGKLRRIEFPYLRAVCSPA
jgi:hypothetical protein